MLSFEETGAMLDEIVDAIPADLLEGLNGGVVLLPQGKHNSRIPSDQYWVMGTYHTHPAMGKWIELYYGSLSAVYRYASAEELRQALERIVHHELRHHVESRAGCDDLVREDNAYVEQALDRLRQNPPSNSP